MASSTGYEPNKKDNGSRWNRELFDGDETKYEILETKFLGDLCTVDLKDFILGKNLNRDETERERNEVAYAELMQFLDDKKLSLVMREALNNERAALRILRDHFVGPGKPELFLFILN